MIMKVCSFEWHAEKQRLEQTGSTESHKVFIRACGTDNMMKFEIFYFVWSQNCVFSFVCSCLVSDVADIAHTIKPFSNLTHFNFVLYLSNNKVRLPRECFDLDKTFYLKLYILKIPLLLWKGAYYNGAEHEKINEMDFSNNWDQITNFLY